MMALILVERMNTRTRIRMIKSMSVCVCDDEDILLKSWIIITMMLLLFPHPSLAFHRSHFPQTYDGGL